PYNEIVALRVNSNFASKHETMDKAGMANLCLRLLAAGTEHSTEEEISDRLERNGSHYKAEAGKDISLVELLTTRESLQTDIEMLLETIDSPTFLEKKLAREKEIVRMSILEQEDSRLTLTMRNFRQHYYGEHPYAWSNMGLVSTLDQITRDDLVAFAEKAFDPSQLLVTVVGGTEAGETLDRVQTAFTHRPSRNGVLDAASSPANVAVQADLDVVEHRESEAEYIVMGYPGCGMTAKDAIPLRIIGAILGGSMDSRLFREIRDKRGLCYQVGATFSPQHEHTPLLMYMVTSPANRQEAVKCAEAEIERLKEELVDEDELRRVKTYINGNYVMAMETNRGQVSRYSTYEMAGLGWDYTNQFPEQIDAVTAEQLRDVARRCFTHRLVTITSPPPSE
ncbi:hypothetical protein GF373_07500, partial [bacterium]|nr:hypothetical protein [bacterium]